MLLTDGDVTKRDAVLWDTPLQEIDPYLRRMVERRAADLAILAFMGWKLPWDAPEEPPTEQDIGEACGQKLVEPCGAFFGDRLFVACRDCPGPERFN